MILTSHYLYVRIINLVSTDAESIKSVKEVPALLPSRNIRKEEIAGNTTTDDLRRINRPRPMLLLASGEAIFQSSDALSSATIANDKQIVLSRLRLNRA